MWQQWDPELDCACQPNKGRTCDRTHCSQAGTVGPQREVAAGPARKSWENLQADNELGWGLSLATSLQDIYEACWQKLTCEAWEWGQVGLS